MRSYVINIRLQTSLKNVHRDIQLNQEAWFKQYIDMSTELKNCKK